MAETRGSALPEPQNRFVGREAERDELAALSARSRLVTLVGPGGCGKTRLAIEVARTQPAVALVDLSAVRDPAAVRTLLDGLTEQLESTPTLLLLDNCEQVIEPVREQVAQGFGRCRNCTFSQRAESPFTSRRSRSGRCLHFRSVNRLSCSSTEPPLARALSG